jgi:hypothetical protein
MCLCGNCVDWIENKNNSGLILRRGKCKNKEIKKWLEKNDSDITYSTNYCWWGIEK